MQIVSQVKSKILSYVGIQIRKLVYKLIPFINSNLTQKGTIMQGLTDINVTGWTQLNMTQAIVTLLTWDAQAWSTRTPFRLIPLMPYLGPTTPLLWNIQSIPIQENIKN